MRFVYSFYLFWLLRCMISQWWCKFMKGYDPSPPLSTTEHNATSKGAHNCGDIPYLEYENVYHYSQQRTEWLTQPLSILRQIMYHARAQSLYSMRTSVRLQNLSWYKTGFVSREDSKLRYSSRDQSNPCKIWQAYRQQRYRDVCHISEQLDNYNTRFRGFEVFPGFGGKTPYRVYSISQEICTRFCCALLGCGYAVVHNKFTWSI